MTASRSTKDSRDDRVSSWIVELNSRPFAYMQDYSVHGWDEHHFEHLPPGSRGIDQYIGDPMMIGHGQRTAFIRRSGMHELFAAGGPVIAVSRIQRRPEPSPSIESSNFGLLDRNETRLGA